MTNTEIMLCDAEYWAGVINGTELLEIITKEEIARVAFLENEYGKFRDTNDDFVPLGNDASRYSGCDHRSWFSLLIAAAEDESPTLREQMDAAWPFPVVHREIPG